MLRCHYYQIFLDPLYSSFTKNKQFVEPFFVLKKESEDNIFREESNNEHEETIHLNDMGVVASALKKKNGKQDSLNSTFFFCSSYHTFVVVE